MKRKKYIIFALSLGAWIACIALIALFSGCATKGGTVALNIGTSRTSAVAGGSNTTDAVTGMEGGGTLTSDATVPLN